MKVLTITEREAWLLDMVTGKRKRKPVPENAYVNLEYLGLCDFITRPVGGRYIVVTDAGIRALAAHRWVEVKELGVVRKKAGT